jgi:hypothetical protein
MSRGPRSCDREGWSDARPVRTRAAPIATLSRAAKNAHRRPTDASTRLTLPRAELPPCGDRPLRRGRWSQPISATDSTLRAPVESSDDRAIGRRSAGLRSIPEGRLTAPRELWPIELHAVARLGWRARPDPGGPRSKEPSGAPLARGVFFRPRDDSHSTADACFTILDLAVKRDFESPEPRSS